MKEYTDVEKENIGHEIAGLLSLSTRGSAKGKPVYFCLHEIRNAIDVFDIVRGIGNANSLMTLRKNISRLCITSDISCG